MSRTSQMFWNEKSQVRSGSSIHVSASWKSCSPRATDVCDRSLFEQFHDSPLPFPPHALHAASAKKRAVGMLSHAGIQRDRTFDRLDDVPERHDLGGTSQHVAAVWTTARAHEP